jgi:DNA-binding transcriptional LysR family regulator
VLAATDPLMKRKRIALKDLKDRDFGGLDENHMPGRNRGMTGVCRLAGFKPRIVASIDGITHVLSQVASEGGVTLLPDYFLDFKHPGVAFRSMADKTARGDFNVLWQRGKIPTTTRALVAALTAAAKDAI